MNDWLNKIFIKAHRFVSMTGWSLGGSSGCIKAECDDYCGRSPSDFMLWFEMREKIKREASE